MNLAQALILLLAVESAAALLAALVWRDRLAALARRLLGLEGGELGDEEYAGRLADAFRRVKWLKEKSSLESGAEQAGLYEEALDCLRRSGGAFRSRPAVSARFGEPLLRGCELLAYSLERQLTQLDASKAAAAAAPAGSLESNSTDPLSVDPELASEKAGDEDMSF